MDFVAMFHFFPQNIIELLDEEHYYAHRRIVVILKHVHRWRFDYHLASKNDVKGFAFVSKTEYFLISRISGEPQVSVQVIDRFLFVFSPLVGKKFDL